jgi:hypothetical protein
MVHDPSVSLGMLMQEGALENFLCHSYPVAEEMGG